MLPWTNEEEILREAIYNRLKETKPNKYKQLRMDTQRKWKNPQ
jgi:hypothetical protein